MALCAVGRVSLTSSRVVLVCGIAGPIPLPVALKVRLQWAGPRLLQLLRPWVPQDPTTFPL
jgi:hypothetical protein